MNEGVYRNNTYDAKGRLTSSYINVAYSGWGNQSYRYTYDNYGNRTCKMYYYSNDVLQNYTWERGRLLVSITNGSGTIGQYTYDINGVRYTKTTSNGTTTYYYNGNTLLGEDGPNGKLRYFYDANGICGFSRTTGTYTGNYVYVKDVLGNIVMLKNVTGAIVAKYSYDEWGNHIVMDANGNEHASAGFIGNINPFRYRGYYYDTESNLYYLMSRYYDPEIGQFISMDSVDYLAPDEIGGVDLYAYCLNNPIMNVDPTGEFCFLATCIIVGAVAGAVIGAAVGGTVAYNIAQETGASGWELFGWTVLGILGGAIVGGTIGGIVGASVGVMATGLSALGMSLFGGGSLALAGGGIVGGTTVAVGVSAGTAIMIGVISGALGIGILFMSKPNSGKIRYSDGTGKDPGTGKPIEDKDKAYEIYHNLTDPIEKAKWKRWMKGKGWRTSHLHGLVFLPLVGEWFRRSFTGEW